MNVLHPRHLRESIEFVRLVLQGAGSIDKTSGALRAGLESVETIAYRVALKTEQ